MRTEHLIVVLGIGAALLVTTVPLRGQEARGAANRPTASRPWQPERLPDGQPDVQGIWAATMAGSTSMLKPTRRLSATGSSGNPCSQPGQAAATKMINSNADSTRPANDHELVLAGTSDGRLRASLASIASWKFRAMIGPPTIAKSGRLRA